MERDGGRERERTSPKSQALISIAMKHFRVFANITLQSGDILPSHPIHPSPYWNDSKNEHIGSL